MKKYAVALGVQKREEKCIVLRVVEAVNEDEAVGMCVQADIKEHPGCLIDGSVILGIDDAFEEKKNKLIRWIENEIKHRKKKPDGPVNAIPTYEYVLDYVRRM